MQLRLIGARWRKNDYKYPEEDISRYLGARYSLEDVDQKNPDGARELVTDMDDYVAR